MIPVLNNRGVIWLNDVTILIVQCGKGLWEGKDISSWVTGSTVKPMNFARAYDFAKLNPSKLLYGLIQCLTITLEKLETNESLQKRQPSLKCDCICTRCSSNSILYYTMSDMNVTEEMNAS